MNGYETDEAVAEMIAGMESDLYGEADYGEAPARFNRRFTTRPFRPLPSVPVRPAPGPSNNANAGIAQLSAQVKALEGRVNTINSNVTRMGNTLDAGLKKEAADRKKDTDAIRAEIRQVRELSALLPILSAPQSRQITEQVGGLPAGTKVVVDTGDAMTTLLPLLLLSGSGSGGMFGSSSGSSGGLDSSMLLVLLLAMRR